MLGKWTNLIDIENEKLLMDKGKNTKNSVKARETSEHLVGYDAIVDGISDLLESARRTSAQAVNAIMTATYWEIGRRIVEYEQTGNRRAGYGIALLEHISTDLTTKYKRGFSVRNLRNMRSFYLAYKEIEIRQSLPAEFDLSAIAQSFPLPWTSYVKLLNIKSPEARTFYEEEALRGGWSTRQLERQISTQFYTRALLSKNKAAMLKKMDDSQSSDLVTPEEEIKNPFILEFLGLKDEYSESELEDALIHRLEDFLLELGNNFTFVGRQRKLRIDDEWYRVDLTFFHRRLRALVIIDLKLGKFTHADAGQMHMYLNYAREHWTLPDENPPVGLILCASKGSMVAKYSLEGLQNKVLAAEYRTALPNENELIEELKKARKLLEGRMKS